MKIKYTIPVLAILLAAVSCSEKPNDADISAPIIRVSSSIGTESKSVLEPSDITTGSEIRLYDILSQNSYQKWIDGKTATYGTPDWTIAGSPYSWLDGATKLDHHFFAWLTKDKAGLTDAGMFGSALSLSGSGGTYTVSVPAKEMTLSSTQFDFCYSDIVDRMISDANYSVVNLPLEHFFSCFGFKFHNYTSDNVTVTSVKLRGLTNIKSGSISYDVANGAVATSYTTATVGGKTGKSWTDAASAVQLLSSSLNLSGDTAGDVCGTYLMWPQTAEELEDAYVDITYTINGGTPTTKSVCLLPVETTDEHGDPVYSTNGWDAGTRHILELGLHDKEFILTVKVAPWDLKEASIDYSGELSVKETGKLQFKSPGTFCTVDDTTHKVYFKGGNPITIYFTIDAPLDATWQITKKGDWDYFEIDNAALTEYNDPAHDSNYGTVDGNTATVTIYPMVPDPEFAYEMQLSFSVRTNSGKEINADKLIQGDDPTQYYTFVLN